MLPPVWL